MVSKKDIRKYILEKRNQIELKEWEEQSKTIFKKVTSHPFFLHAENIFCYLDYNKEVGTRQIIEKAWRLGKRVAVPRVEGNDMYFYEIHDFTQIASGYRGILEPVTSTRLETTEGLVIVPGVVFDKNCNRIGYGKGFYDRYLQKRQMLDTMALAFEMQVFDEIPAEETDYRPKMIVTEENIYV